MPRKQRNNKQVCDSSESESSSDVSAPCYDQSRACIICPPRDHHEKFDSSVQTDSSCPDLTELCEDRPRVCKDKKKLCKKSNSKSPTALSDLQDDHSSKESSDEKQGRKGCAKQCNRCDLCLGSESNNCEDHSDASVVAIFSNSSSECPRLDKLDRDAKKKCVDLVSPCNKSPKKPVNKPCNKPVKKPSKKCESSKFSSCDLPEPKKCDKKPKKEKNNKKEVSSDLFVSECSVVDKPDKVVSKEKDNVSKKGSSSGTGKKFVVTFSDKSGHPWSEYNESPESVHLNGKNGAIMHLYRGCQYFFCVEQEVKEGEDPQHSFFLTNSPMGGAGSRIINGGFSPVSRGCVCFKVDNNTPRIFFYQDGKHGFAGGVCMVHDK